MIDCDDRINTPKKTIPIETGEAKANRCKIFNALMGAGINGMTTICAAAICGNIFGESGYNPNAVNPSSGAYGICQWLDRKVKLKRFAVDNNKPISDIDLQINYLIYELKNSEKNAWKMISGTDKIEKLGEITKKFCNGFERPGEAACNKDYDKRFKAAKRAYEACKEEKNADLV